MDNPHSKTVGQASDSNVKTVLTVSGIRQPLSKCRKIDNLFYFIGDINTKDSGDCYIIPESTKIIRNTNPRLIWNCSLNRYTLKTVEVKGVVKIDKTNVELGWFNPSISNVLVYTDEGEQLAISTELEGFSNVFIYDPINMLYIHRSRYRKSDIDEYLMGGHRKKQYPSFPGEYYSAAESPYKEAVDSTKAQFKDDELDSYLEGKTLGIEFETKSGSIPQQDLFKHGVIPIKDGSIAGHEFVTTIIQPKGATNLIRSLCRSLSEYTRVDQTCSLHFHIGGFNYKDKSSVVSLYLLWYRIQDEIDSLMPIYKRALSYLANKKGGAKDHCARLPDLGILEDLSARVSIDEIFNNILFLCNDNQGTPRYSDGVYVHSHGDRAKWDQHGRYYGINFLPLLFEKKHTVEFRIHSGTTNEYKTIYWLLICLAIMKFAEERKTDVFSDVTKIRLSNVIDFAYGTNNQLLNNILEYINLRKKAHKINTLKGELYGDEFTQDGTFKFKY